MLIVQFMNRLLLCFAAFLVSSSLFAGATGSEMQPSQSPYPEDQNSRELFEYETTYTEDSNLYDDHGKFGHGDYIYKDFRYAYRFFITNNCIFRPGVCTCTLHTCDLSVAHAT